MMQAVTRVEKLQRRMAEAEARNKQRQRQQESAAGKHCALHKNPANVQPTDGCSDELPACSALRLEVVCRIIC